MNRSSLIQVFLVGFLGGVVAIGMYVFFVKHHVEKANDLEKELYSNDFQQPHVQQVSSQERVTVSTSMPSLSEPAKSAMPVVVHIKAEESEAAAEKRIREEGSRGMGIDILDFFLNPDFRRKGSGSGVIISNNGYIVTNNHVVGFANYFEVTLNDGRRYSAIKIGTDPNSDLAVLKIDAVDLPTIEMADSDAAQIGDWVLAIGNPFDYLTSTVTAGIISAKGRNLNLIEGKKTVESFIQTDAAINPGNSGGALVDEKGRLLGINTAIATPNGVFAGYSFAIPVNTMQNIVKKIIENGEVIYPYVGAEVTTNDSELAEQFGIPDVPGVVIMNIDPRGPAKLAGLLPQDLIISIDNTEVNSAEELNSIINKLSPGIKVELEIYRKKEFKTVLIYLSKG